MSDGTDETQEFAPPKADQTAPITLPAPSRPQHTVNLGLLFLAVAAAAFLIGIAIASATRTGEGGVVVADQRVTSSGGTVRFTGGELRIPRDALAEPARIVIRRQVFTNRVGVRLPTNTTGVVDSGRLVAYSFAPHDLGFRKPVRIVLRLSGDSQNGTIFASKGNKTTVLGGDVDGDRGTVTLEVRTFRFGVV